MTEEANRERARALVAAHSKGATQILRDEIVAAMIVGTDRGMASLQQQLHYAERMIDRSPRA